MREETGPGWPNHAKGQLESEPQESAQVNYKRESRRRKYMCFEGSSVSEKGPVGSNGNFHTSCFNRKEQLFEFLLLVLVLQQQASKH